MEVIKINKIRVLFIASYSGTSGANHSLVTLVKLLKEFFNVEPFVIIPNSGPIEVMLEEDNISYKIVKFYPWVISKNRINHIENAKWLLKKTINTLNEQRIKKILLEKNIELVHLNGSTISFGAKIGIENGIPVIWHIREFLEQDLNKEFWNKEESLKLLNRASSIITISNSVKNNLDKRIDLDYVTTIYNGIDTDKYEQLDSSLFVNKIITLTIAGRISPNKGQEEAIMAIKQLVLRGYKKILLQIVGSEGDDQYLSKLKNIVSENNLYEYVSFIDYVKDIEKMWAGTDIALVCSDAEAFGRVTIEASLANCVVVASNTGASPELLEDKFGYLYEKGNVTDLADKLQYILENTKKAIEIANFGKENAVKHFSAMENAENIYNLYSNVLISKEGN